MDKKDLHQIKQIVDKSIDSAIETKAPKIVEKSIKQTIQKTVKPSFDHVFNRLDKIERAEYLMSIII